MKRRHFSLLVACAGAGGTGSLALAQGRYPEKPIRLIVPFAAGGGTDAVARQLGTALAGRLKQAIVIDNRGGAGSALGTAIAAKAPADGYTLLFASAAHSFSPSVYAKLPYAQSDFAAIAIVNGTPLMLTLHPSVPARDLQSFIALLKYNPGKYMYASSGTGTTLHIAAEYFLKAANVKATHVPYRGEAPALADVLGGQVAFMVGQASTAVPYLKDGRLVGIGVTTPARISNAPGIPTLAEAGLPGFSAYGWNAILAPRGTPPGVLDFLNKEINGLIAGQELQKGFADLGLDRLEPVSTEGAERFIASETAKWGAVIREAGIKSD